ncbi:Uncharacterised protein [uncultured archaeon]|nr:Uncharacterised protein [uncultured archaeon]
MGDGQYRGTADFGGQETNFNCLPDGHYTKCPSREQGLGGDFDNQFWCKLTAGPDADGRGFGYDLCNFCGDNFHECQRYVTLFEKLKVSGK